MENSIKYASLLQKYIFIEKNKNPNKYIDIDRELKNYKNLTKNFNSTENPIFILSLLSKCYEKTGIKVFVTDKKDQNLENIEMASIQSLISFVGQKKYEIHFDFGEKKNQKILNDENEKKKFISEYKEKLSKALKIESQKLIFTDIRHGCVQVTAIIINPENENPLNLLNERDIKNLSIIDIKEMQTIKYLQISKNILEPRADREEGFWGEGQIRGGNVYFPPINGWKGLGLKVLDQYDNGNNDWLSYENWEGEFSIAYLGNFSGETNELMKYREKIDIRRSNNKCGDGIPLFQDPEYLEKEEAEGFMTVEGEVDIIGYRIKVLLMCRVNPKKIREPENCNNVWILNPTPDEVRPYRILVKKIAISPQACANEMIVETNPIRYIIDI